jgi:hypothetical protein
MDISGGNTGFIQTPVGRAVHAALIFYGHGSGHYPAVYVYGQNVLNAAQSEKGWFYEYEKLFQTNGGFTSPVFFGPVRGTGGLGAVW